MRSNCKVLRPDAIKSTDEVDLVITDVAGESLCSLRCQRDITLERFQFLLSSALSFKLEYGDVLIHGGEYLSARTKCEGRHQPFLGSATGCPVQLALVIQENVACNRALAMLESSNLRARQDALVGIAGDLGVAVKGDKLVIDMVLACLEHKQGIVRVQALQALAQIAEEGDQSVINAVTAQLQDLRWSIRDEAARVLEQLAGRPDVINVVKARREDPCKEVRRWARGILRGFAT